MGGRLVPDAADPWPVGRQALAEPSQQDRPPGTEGDGGGGQPPIKNLRGDVLSEGLGAAGGKPRPRTEPGGGQGGVSRAGQGHLGQGVLGLGSRSSGRDVRGSVSGAVQVAWSRQASVARRQQSGTRLCPWGVGKTRRELAAGGGEAGASGWPGVRLEVPPEMDEA